MVMELFGPPPAPRPPCLRRVARDALAGGAPWYLVSALCMIAGCLLLTRTFDPKPGDCAHLLVLAGTLQVYEAVLIGLAAVLFRRGGPERDGRILLLLEALFLADATFLALEAYTPGWAFGAAVNLAIAAAALIKAGIVFRALGLPRLSAAAAAGLLLPGLSVLAVPGLVTAWTVTYGTGPEPFHAAWWWLGLCLALRPAWGAGLGVTSGAGAGAGAAAAFLRTLDRVLPASLGVHILAAHWVFGVAVHACDFAPVLLGLAAAEGGARSEAALVRRLAFTAAAVALASFFPAALRMEVAGVAWTPFRSAVAVAALIGVHTFLVHDLPWLAVATAACVALGVAGDGPLASLRVFGRLLVRVGRWMVGAIPDTAAEWGVACVGAAFGLLAAGAVASLRRAPGTGAAPPLGGANGGGPRRE